MAQEVSLTQYWLGTYAVLLGSWLIPCLCFEAFERIGMLNKHLIQPHRRPTAALKKHALYMAFLNWAWLPFALRIAAPLLAVWFPDASRTESLSSVICFVVQVAISFFVDDFCFYIYHRVLHEYPQLYVRFHKPHHVFTAPFVWTSHAVHPVEIILQSIGAMMGPIIFSMPLRHYWVWLTIRQIQGVLDHTGYDFPWDPIRWVPGVGGTKFHDDHHRHFTCNYASCFSFIDDMFGTRYSSQKIKR